jgi:hypothetical protein
MEVKSWSVDDLASQFGVPDVLFIDVEGFECEVLQGAQKTLASRPACFIEVHVGAGLEKFGGTAERVLRLLPAGYQRFVAQPDTPFVPLTENSPVLLNRFFLVAIPSERAQSSQQPDLVSTVEAGEGGSAR